jgi:hypothetical protein
MRGIYAPGLQARNAGQALNESTVRGISNGFLSLVDRTLIDLECLHDFDSTRMKRFLSIRACLNRTIRGTMLPMDQREMASKGGKARWKGIGKRKRRALAQSAVKVRWDKERKRKENAV